MNKLTRSWIRRPTWALIGAALAGLALPALAGPMPAGLEQMESIIIPVVAILMVFGAPALTVILVGYFVLRYRERRQGLINERIQKFLEAGQPVPENLLEDSQVQASPDRHLHQGLMLLGFGIGLSIFLSLFMNFALGSVGLVFVGLGLAKVLIWKLSAEPEQR